MADGQLGVIRRTLLALVVGFLPATGLVAATIEAPEASPFAVPLVWQQNFSGGMGFASLAMALPRRNIQPQTVAPLPVATSQMIFSLAPICGPVFSFARNSKVVSSTTLTQWRKNYISQAIEVDVVSLARAALVGAVANGSVGGVASERELPRSQARTSAATEDFGGLSFGKRCPCACKRACSGDPLARRGGVASIGGYSIPPPSRCWSLTIAT